MPPANATSGWPVNLTIRKRNRRTEDQHVPKLTVNHSTRRVCGDWTRTLRHDEPKTVSTSGGQLSPSGSRRLTKGDKHRQYGNDNEHQYRLNVHTHAPGSPVWMQASCESCPKLVIKWNVGNYPLTSRSDSGILNES